VIRLSWYRWFLNMRLGEIELERDPEALARECWKAWSPKCQFTEAEFAATAKSFHNPDWIATTLKASSWSVASRSTSDLRTCATTWRPCWKMPMPSRPACAGCSKVYGKSGSSWRLTLPRPTTRSNASPALMPAASGCGRSPEWDRLGRSGPQATLHWR